jgi:putative tryptophan/tyrosine transport system substrate-binding protein
MLCREDSLATQSMPHPTHDEARGAARIPRRRLLRGAAGCVLLLSPLALLAQAAATVPRIGFLSSDASSDRVQETFRQGMRDQGLIEGRQFAMQWGFAEGDYARLPALANACVASGVDVIVAVTTLAVQAARRATSKLPIVMVAVPDPIGEGFAQSLSRPGGNITGISNIVTEVSVKHLELLHMAVPKLGLVAVLINPLNPSDSLILEQIQGAAYVRKLKILPVEASTVAQIDAGFAVITAARAEALIVAADAFFDVRRQLIVGHTLRSRLPAMFANREMAEAGGLMSYGQDLASHYRRAAGYVDRILKGTPPGMIPIEQPTVLEFVVNQKTAAAIGVTIPQQLMLRADKVIA